jgi:hypothetical protein
MTNWYNWAHIRHVLSMSGSVSHAQRFKLASCQPSEPDTRRGYLTVYEVADKALCTAITMDWAGTVKYEISTAFDVRSFAEAYWDIVRGTADFATYADYAGDRSVLVARLDGGDQVEATLPAETLADLADRPGLLSAHLARLAADQAPTSAAQTETVSHVLIAQLTDTYLAVRSWDAFAAEAGLDALQAAPAVYRPVIRRLSAAQRTGPPQWQALSFLTIAGLGLSDKTPVYPSR